MLNLHPPQKVRKAIPAYQLPLLLQLVIGLVTLPHELAHIGMAKLLKVAPVELYLFHFAWKKSDHPLWKQRLVLLAPFVLSSLLLVLHLLIYTQFSIITLYLAGQPFVCVIDLYEIISGKNPTSKSILETEKRLKIP